jgi:AraC-like DNA-binding protein
MTSARAKLAPYSTVFNPRSHAARETPISLGESSWGVFDTPNYDFLLVRPCPNLFDHFLGMRSGLCSDVELRDRACGEPCGVGIDDSDNIGGLAADRQLTRPGEHRPADRVQNALADGVNMQERSLAVEHFLRSQLHPVHVPNGQIEAAASTIRQSGGRVSIDKLANQQETSHSTLERRFRAEVGVTPKTLSRLARLQNVYRLWDTGKPLTEVAYEAGFSDQSHLTHDFKGFTGSAAEIFLSQRVSRNLPTFYS